MSSFPTTCPNLADLDLLILILKFEFTQITFLYVFFSLHLAVLILYDIDPIHQLIFKGFLNVRSWAEISWLSSLWTGH